MALLGVLVAAGVAPADPSTHEIDGEPGCDLCSQAKTQWLSQRRLPPTPAIPGEAFGGDPAMLGDTDVLNYALELELLTANQTYSGTCTITTRSLVNGLTTMDIELASTFNVPSVTVAPVVAGLAGTPTPVTFSRPVVGFSQVMRVNLDRVYNAGQEFAVTITYNGAPATGGFGSTVWTTNAAGSPLICTLSETRFAHTWWPVKENNSDKATGDLRFIVPDTLTVASQGLLVSEEALPGSRKRFRWVTNYPTSPYLFSFSASVYDRFTDTWTWTAPPGIGGTQTATTLLQNFIYPASNTANNRAQWLFNKDRMTTLSNLWGVYPFHLEKYGVYQFFFSGGMEHQTFSGQGGNGTIPFGAALSVHELGHQWFGDHVTCATWNDIWLNEGFATYAECLWGEFRPANLGANGFDEYKLRMSQRRPSSVADSVYVYDASIANEGRIFSNTFSYRKGAWVNHMLRRVMGDANYFQALRNYLATHAGGTASTADLQQACEALHGSSLGWFFSQWVYGIGAPTYQFAVRPVEVNGQNYAELFVEQTQPGNWPFASADNSVPFSMPLEVATSVNGQPATLKFFNETRRQHLLLPTAGPVDAVNAALDPNDWVLAVASSTSTASAGSKIAVAFPPAPPKVVVTSPAAGSVSRAGTVGSVTITVHEPLVAASTGAFSLARGGQSVAGSVSRDASGRTLTFTPASPLRVGAYTATVLASNAISTQGIALDGEANAALPSGNGVAGGNFVLSFTLEGCGLSDLAAPGQAVGGDGVLTADDIIVFLNWFFASDARSDVAGPGQSSTPDAAFTADDIIVFLNRFFAGC